MVSLDIKRFKELELEELYRFLQLRNEIFIVEQASIYQDLDDMDQEALHILMKEGELLIGYSRIIRREGRLSLGRVLLDENYRKKGLGRKLIAYSLDYMEKNYEDRYIYIEAQSYLVELYEDFGFVRTSEDYSLDGVEHCRMKKKIN